jgi:hypothetical protein
MSFAEFQIRLFTTFSKLQLKEWKRLDLWVGVLLLGRRRPKKMPKNISLAYALDLDNKESNQSF